MISWATRIQQSPVGLVLARGRRTRPPRTVAEAEKIISRAITFSTTRALGPELRAAFGLPDAEELASRWACHDWYDRNTDRIKGWLVRRATRIGKVLDNSELKLSELLDRWPAVKLIAFGDSALEEGQDSVEHFLRNELGATVHPLSRSILAEALWEVLTRHPESIVKVPGQKAAAYLGTAVRRKGKQLLVLHGTAETLGTNDQDSMGIDRRAAVRLSRGKDWKRSQQVDLCDAITELSRKRNFEVEASILLTRCLAVAKNDRERAALHLIAKTGDVPYARKETGLSVGEFRALQDRLARNIDVKAG